MASLMLIDCLVVRAVAWQGPSSSESGQRFEVASIKSNRSTTPPQMRLEVSGRFAATNVSTIDLMVRAYGVRDFRISGAPSWFRDERFDVVAKTADDAAGSPGVNTRMLVMLQTLLTDRWGLQLRREMRSTDVYVLMMARDDGRWGSRMRPSELACSAYLAGRASGQVREFRPECGARFANAAGLMVWNFGGVPLGELTRLLEPAVGRPILNETGLDATFDLELSFDQTSVPRLPQWRPQATGDLAAPAATSGPDLFRALREQLGLKLEARQRQIEQLVVDSAHRPILD